MSQQEREALMEKIKMGPDTWPDAWDLPPAIFIQFKGDEQDMNWAPVDGDNPMEDAATMVQAFVETYPERDITAIGLYAEGYHTVFDGDGTVVHDREEGRTITVWDSETVELATIFRSKTEWEEATSQKISELAESRTRDLVSETVTHIKEDQP